MLMLLICVCNDIEDKQLRHKSTANSSKVGKVRVCKGEIITFEKKNMDRQVWMT